MKALLYFGFVEESTEIHSLVERLLRAEFVCKQIKSVEQEEVFKKIENMEEVFYEKFNKKKQEDEFNLVLNEWNDVKFFKH